MDSLEIAFWSCAACAVYTYALYPLALAIAARLWGHPVRIDRAAAVGPVSVVVAAYNEEATIGRRLEELGKRVADLAAGGEVIAVSDGSTDRTAEVARARAGVRVLERSENRGKAVSLNEGWAAAKHAITVFADTRQSWAPDALEVLLENFADPTVGAVSGELVLETAPGVMAGVGVYWRFETWMRRGESRLHSTVGLTGAICAVRRDVFRPIPPGTILDDVYWPLRVAMQGYRVVFDGRARAFDRLPVRARDEFRRKVRTLGGNYQLVARLPSALLPWRNPVWFQFVSHKLFRLLVPWALLGLMGTAALLDGTFYRFALAAQIAFYLLGLTGCWTAAGSRSRVASAAASFLMLNAAAWIAFWVWVTGRLERSWGKVAYKVGPPDSHSTEPADRRMGMTGNGPGITTAGKTNG
jgi:biofilm PGA synthesis N-glycosyltransferase PgaC